MALEIPEVVINRLPIYARALAALADQGEWWSAHRPSGRLWT